MRMLTGFSETAINARRLIRDLHPIGREDSVSSEDDRGDGAPLRSLGNDSMVCAPQYPCLSIL